MSPPDPRAAAAARARDVLTTAWGLVLVAAVVGPRHAAWLVPLCAVVVPAALVAATPARAPVRGATVALGLLVASLVASVVLVLSGRGAPWSGTRLAVLAVGLVLLPLALGSWAHAHASRDA